MNGLLDKWISYTRIPSIHPQIQESIYPITLDPIGCHPRVNNQTGLAIFPGIANFAP